MPKAKRTQFVRGQRIRNGRVLARGRVRATSDTEVRVRLRPTRIGRKALRADKVGRAVIEVGPRSRVVRIRH